MHKLIFVINTLQKGGAERVLSTLGNSFSERDYEVTIVCMNHAEHAYRISAAVKVIHLLNSDRKEGFIYRVYYGMKIWLGLLALLWKERPRCVISFMTSANLWTGLSCRVLSIPYIVSERTTPDLTVNRLTPFFKYLSFWIYRRSKAVVIPAKGMEDCMKKDNVFKKLNNYTIIKNPVNTFKITSKKPLHPRKFILGAGRLAYEKGFDQLIEAFSKLRVQHIDLLIIGAGAEEQRLIKQISRLKLEDRVFLTGIKNEVQDYYSQAEIFVLPSRNEGYPNVLIEAMSMGCACIAMDCEYGPAEIIEHGVNGMLVQNGNINDMAKIIFNVLFEPSLKQNLGFHARKISQTNSLNSIADQWERLILN